MSPVNSTRVEESSPVIFDEGTINPDAGYTINYINVLRTGSLVAMHFEVAFAIGAAAPVLTVDAFYAPSATITDSTGKFTLSAGGVLSFTGATTAAGTAVGELVFQAGEAIPD